ncbi:MAG TPA: alpha/beta fold hydrolase [Longimicrobiales bacterium]|nr:alpha/beta fold hydrolase [Longimicrobiales bacterium]
MQFRVLGPIEVQTASGAVVPPSGAKQRLLLAVLLLHAPRVLSADRLIDMLWGDQLPSDPHAALRTQISRLRTLLAEAGAEGLLTRADPAGYRITCTPADLDVTAFEHLAARARASTDPARALADADEALALWRDEPYVELEDLPYFLGETARLRQLRNSVREHRVETLLALGRTAEAVADSACLVMVDPLSERSRALAMQALYSAGRHHDALATFQDYRRLLAEELGLDPSPGLSEMERQIIQHARTSSLIADRGTGYMLATAADAGVRQHVGPSQDIRFTTSADGVRLAYATVGTGPPLVKAANWLNHLEFDWESPVWRRLFRELAARGTLIRYDERGTGLSDRDPDELSLDTWVHDLECIVDACGLERFPLLGISQGCAVCIEYAARHPARVSGLILHGGYAAGWRADPSFGPAEIARRDASIEIVRHGWGEDTPAYRQMFTQTFIPGGTAAEIEWFNELQRRSVSPATAARFMEAFAYIDVRDRLAQVHAPTLVLHSRGDQRIHFEKGRELAMGIPGARFVLLESHNHLILEHEPAFDYWMREALRFLAEETSP